MRQKFVDEYIMQNEYVKRLEKRVDVWVAVAEDSKEKFEEALKESVDEKKKGVSEDVDKLKEELAQAKQKLAEKRSAYTKRMKLAIKHNPKMTVRRLLDKPMRIKDYLKKYYEEHKDQD